MQHACPAGDDRPRSVTGEDDECEDVHGQPAIARVKGVGDRAADHRYPHTTRAALLRSQLGAATICASSRTKNRETIKPAKLRDQICGMNSSAVLSMSDRLYTVHSHHRGDLVDDVPAVLPMSTRTSEIIRRTDQLAQRGQCHRRERNPYHRYRQAQDELFARDMKPLRAPLSHGRRRANVCRRAKGDEARD